MKAQIQKERKDEVEIDYSSIYKINPILYKVCPSICKIIFSKKIGTGFFIKLYKGNKPLFLLMTNEHIITKDMIAKKEEIEVYYNNQNCRIKLTLNKEKRFIQSYKEELKIDCTIVEIINKDNVREDYFLHPNIDYNDNNFNELKNKIVYVVQFPGGKDLSYSKGKLKNIDKYEFIHKAGTKSGSSGSPIFLDNTTNVIGIHKSGNKLVKENYGDFIFPIINLLNKKMNNNIISKNYINDSNIIHKQNEVKIIIEVENPFFFLFGEEFVNNNKDKCEIIINGKNGFKLNTCWGNKNGIYFEDIDEIFKKNNNKAEIILRETKTIRNMDNMFFFNLCNLISINFEKWDVSNVTSMKNMFWRCYNIKGISNWNTSNVTNMSYMFHECKKIPDISKWNTSKVLDMSYMFQECKDYSHSQYI